MRIIRDVYMVGSGQIGLSNAYDCHVYLLDGGTELALIDAGVGLSPERIISNIRAEGLSEGDVSHLLLTHSHADHAGGCAALKALTGVKVVCVETEGRLLETGSDEETGLDVARRSGLYPEDYAFQHTTPDRIVGHGDAFRVGRYGVQVIEVPGHSLGSTCYLVDMNGYTVLFSSDVVFHGGAIGLGNWPGSSLDAYRRHIGRLAGLSVDALLPGHFLWTVAGGQEHLDTAVANLRLAWVPPAWQHQHSHR